MTWREAFLSQARSDNGIRHLLNKQQAEYAHQLHYLQMTTEKLAKGLLTDVRATSSPPLVHSAFVRVLQVMKGQPYMRKKLGYAENYRAFCSFIDFVLPLAGKIERLAPSHAGTTSPNPEYPWQPTSGGEVVAPAQYDFPEFHPGDAQMGQLVSLVEYILKTKET